MEDQLKELDKLRPKVAQSMRTALDGEEDALGREDMFARLWVTLRVEDILEVVFDPSSDDVEIGSFSTFGTPQGILIPEGN